MAAGDRESTFVLRASDLSSQPINQVREAIEKLVAQTKALVEASKEGTVKLNDFSKGAADLAKGGGAVARQIGDIERYIKATDQWIDREIKVGNAEERLQALLDKRDVSKLTKKEEAEIARLEGISNRSIEGLQAAADKFRSNTLAPLAEQMARIGVSLGTSSQSVAFLREMLNTATVSMTEMNAADREFLANQQRAAAAIKDRAAAEKTLKTEQDAAAKSAKDAADARLAEERRVLDALHRRAEEEKKIDADVEKGRQTQRQNVYGPLFDEAIQREEAGKKLEQAREAAYAERAQREEALAKQRQMAAQAAAAIPGRQPLGVSATPSGDFSSASAGVAAIIAPAAQARSTIAGLEAEINTLAAGMDQGRLRAQDYNTILRTLGLSIEAMKKQANLVDLYRAQEEATRRAETAMRQEAAALATLQERIRGASGAEKGFETELAAAAKAARDAAVAFNQNNETLATYRAGLEKAGISIYNIDAAIVRLNTSATIGKKVFDEATSKVGGSKDAVLFGLRPYELQNLSYQVNDVITQLSSGTSLSQTLAQQGGQIFQLFQRQVVGAFQALKDIPFGLSAATAAAAVLVVGIMALVRALDEAAARRMFAGQLAASVDGATQSVKGLTQAALDTEKMGINFSEAAKGAAELASIGVVAEKVRPLLAISANISRIWGKPFADSVKEVGGAFSGGYDAMRKFALQYGLLTDKQDEHLHKLFEENKAEQAHNELLAIAGEQFEKARKEGVSPLTDAMDRLHNNWVSFLRTINSSEALAGVANFFATAIHGAENLAKVIARIGNAVPGMLSADMAGVAGVAGEMGIPGQYPGAGTGRKPNAGASPAGSEFTSMRDEAAAAAGLTREAMALLQNSEGLWKDNKWQDSASGARGPMQILQSTFDELKKKYPELLKGSIDDVKTNLLAGALYFRDILKQTGGDFKEAVLGYKNGPGTVTGGGTPEQLAERRGRINPTYRGQNDASAAALAGGLTAPALVGGQAPTTQNALTAARNFAQDLDKETDSIRNTGLAGASAIEREAKVIEDLYKTLRERRDKFAQENHTSADQLAKDNDAIERRVQAQRDQFTEARYAAEVGATNKLRGLQEEVSKADATNLDERRRAVNLYYDTVQSEYEKMRRAPGAPQQVNGKPFEEVFADIERLRNIKLDQTELSVATAVVDKVVKARDDEAARLKEDLARSGTAAETAGVLAKITEFNRRQAGLVNDATRKSDEAMARLPQTPEVEAQRQRNERLRKEAEQGGRGDRQATTQAVGLIDQTSQDMVKQRTAELETVTANVKRGAISFTAGLAEISALFAKSLPEMTRTTQEANKALATVRDLPGTSAAMRAELNDKIAKNNLELAKAPQEILKFITEGLKDEETNFTKLLKQYQEAMADLARRARNGIIDPVARAAEAARLNADFLPRIQAAGTRLAADRRAAAATPGVPAGQQQELLQSAAAAEQQSAPRNIELESTRKGVMDSIAELNKLRDANKAMEATQRELQAKGMTGTFEAEEANRKQYEESYKAAAKIVPTLNQQIEKMRELGATDSEIEKLRAQYKLLGADMTYTSQFTKELTKTIEDSLGNRGMQAIDSIAQALGNVLATGGKLKDVWASIGQAFASFAAGVLKDIATMIIKFYILAAVKSMLGIASGGSTTAFDAMTGAAAGATTAAVKHAGGIAGESNGASRVVDLALFRMARRMHDGGMAGLSADEIPTILQRGELVSTQAEQRRNAAMAAGAGGGGGTGIRNVLAVGDKEIAGAMNGAHGEKVILNVLARNAPTVKKWVG